MNLEELKIEYLPIDSIRPYERNAKKHPNSTDIKLAQNGWIKVHLGGNKTWKKDI